jgi:hypothetical protein
MAPNITPVFVLMPALNIGTFNTANSNRDGTGTIQSMVTGATNGTRVKKITIRALTTTTAGMIRFFANDGSGWRLWMEVPVMAVTVSATVAGWGYQLLLQGENALVLPAGYSLGVATQNGTAFSYVVESGTY